jgi:hypothetical protein
MSLVEPVTVGWTQSRIGFWSRREHQRVDMGEVTRRDRACLGGAELPPAGSLTVGRRIHPARCRMFHTVDGHNDTQPSQLSVDPPVPHVGFRDAHGNTSARTSTAVAGRPPGSVG